MVNCHNRCQLGPEPASVPPRRLGRVGTARDLLSVAVYSVILGGLGLLPGCGEAPPTQPSNATVSEASPTVAVAPPPTTYRPGEVESMPPPGAQEPPPDSADAADSTEADDSAEATARPSVAPPMVDPNDDLVLESPEPIVMPLPEGPPPTDPAVDDDGDGFSEEDGDCNDEDPQSNPGAYDVSDNGVDEDCDGTPDNEPSNCDEGLSLEADDATEAARALGLCRTKQGDSWGLVAARWVFPNGDAVSPEAETCGDLFLGAGAPPGSPPHPLSRGILDQFGPAVAPVQGLNLVAISSGIARPGAVEATDPAQGTSPFGANMTCPALDLPEDLVPQSDCANLAGDPDLGIYLDGIALELEIQAPTNANAFAFSFDFYTFEYPEYVCSEYNDYFAALLYSEHPAVPPSRNISFDRLGNHVSVNAGFVEVCEPAEILGKVFDCPLGTAELEGTGFIEVEQEFPHAATGWLETLSPIVPGELLTLRLAVWDAGDGLLDSTVLLDNLRWVTAEGEIPETPQTMRPPRVR